MQNEQTNETINAYCDTCDCQARAEKSQLEKRGWYCGKNEQFCPECNY